MVSSAYWLTNLWLGYINSIHRFEFIVIHLLSIVVAIMKLFIYLFALVLAAAVCAEKPAPYPPQGWKPQGARLELPPSRTYGAPVDAKNVEFTTLSNEYIPPATESPRKRNEDDDFLSVQGLPAANSNSQFQNFQPLRRPSKTQARIVMAPAPAFGGNPPLLLAPVFAPQFAAPNQQLREQKFGQIQQNPKNDVQILPQQQYAAPQQQQQPRQQFAQKQQQQQFPQQEYGVPQPQQEYGPPSQTDAPEITTENNEPELPQDNIEEDDEEETENDRPVIAVANAEAHAKLLAATQQGQFGQYYILLPDSSLQKVRFATGQSDDDRQANGFSAQLRYLINHTYII